MHASNKLRSEKRSSAIFAAAVLTIGLLVGGLIGSCGAEEEQRPRIIDPGSATRAPSDAVVLFDGSDAGAFAHMDGSDAKWTVEDGALVVKPGSGGLRSITTHGAIQLHLEFATPAEVRGEGQGRGNSGVYLQGRYEVQVLDSYENETYPLGQCGAIYGQHAPLVNASRPPGEWQTYDIIFHPPTFDREGRKLSKGAMTVFHNGILIHDRAELLGPTAAAPLAEGAGFGPIYLQDHGNSVRYRNIWLRAL